MHNLTFNYGLRGDDLNSYRDEKQLSPRANLVWLPLPDMTLHAGYARYFNPPPFELIAQQTVSKFQGTTGASQVAADTVPYAERQNYFDVGGQQRLLQGHLTLGVDVFYRKSHNLIDEGQFGAPIILTPFNYQNGLIFGQEYTASYAKGPLTAYVNFTHQRAQGKDIDSSQFNFGADDLAYISKNYIYLDHDQTYTGSGGASYLIRKGVLGDSVVADALADSRLGFDLLYGSGLPRRPDAGGRVHHPQRHACAELCDREPDRVAPPGAALRRSGGRALRPHQPRQQDLPDPQRHGRGRRGAPVRCGARLLRRHQQDVLIEAAQMRPRRAGQVDSRTTP